MGYNSVGGSRLAHSSGGPQERLVQQLRMSVKEEGILEAKLEPLWVLPSLLLQIV